MNRIEKRIEEFMESFDDKIASITKAYNSLELKMIAYMKLYESYRKYVADNYPNIDIEAIQYADIKTKEK